jgi:hypothetical protein
MRPAIAVRFEIAIAIAIDPDIDPQAVVASGCRLLAQAGQPARPIGMQTYGAPDDVQ